MKKLISVLVCVALLMTSIAALAADKTEILYQDFASDGHPRHEIMQKLIERYRDDNPDVSLIDEMMPEDAYLVQLPALAAANDLPDVMNINGSMMKSFASTGVIRPLTDLAKKYGILDKYHEGSFLESSYEGEIYSIPTNKANYGYILYNKAIFDEVGIAEFPQNLDELHSASVKLLDAGYIPMALGDKNLWPADSITFSTFVNKFTGNEWFDHILAKDGQASFTDPEFIAALAAFQKLVEEKVFNQDALTLDANERLALYMNGKAAMISAGQWENNIISQTAPEIAEATQVAAWPGPAEGAKAGDSVELSCAWGFAIGSNVSDEKAEEVMNLIANYLLSDEYAKEYTELKGNFCPWDYEYDTSKLTVVTVRVADATPNMTACLNWDSVLDASLKEIYQRGLQEILALSITPEQLANNMQTEYESLF